MGANNQKQHFVPQFYLRNFGNEKSVALYNIKSKKAVGAASIREQCQRKYFYGKDLVIEELLSELEGRTSQVMRDIIEKLIIPNQDSMQFIDLMVFIVFQYGRTPTAAEKINEMATQVSREMMRLKPNLPPKIRAGIDSVHVKHNNAVVFSLSSVREIIPVLLDLKLKLFVSDSPDAEFITSDSPVVFFNQWRQHCDDRGTCGFACSGLQIFLPISSKCLLFLYDEEIYSVLAHKHAGVLRLTSYEVHSINALQLTNAPDNLYYSGKDSVLDAIKKMPYKWHVQAKERTTAKPLVESNKNLLIHIFDKSVGRLEIPTIKVLKSKRQILVKDRARSYRRFATAVIQQLVTSGIIKRPGKVPEGLQNLIFQERGDIRG